MTIDYDKIVEDFNIGKLTKKKITASFVRKSFKEEIADLREVLTFGNGEIKDNSVIEEIAERVSEKADSPEIINQQFIPLQRMFMGQEMTTDIWLGYIKSLLQGEFIRTINEQGQTLLVTYDKTEVKSQGEKVALEVGDIPEKEIVAGLKKALVKRF